MNQKKTSYYPDGFDDETRELDAIETTDLGSCCGCGTHEGVNNTVMLPYRAPVPGKGWGCFVCGLPLDGAIAVLCDECLTKNQIIFVCVGYPSDDVRAYAVHHQEDTFKCDPNKHNESEATKCTLQ